MGIDINWDDDDEVISAEELSGPSGQQKDPIAELVDHAKLLHADTDNLNQVLLAVQAALAELKLGVSAEVVIDRDEEDWGCSYTNLWFGKRGSDWVLMVYEDDTSGESGDRREVTSCTREDRILAVNGLPKLLDALKDAVLVERKRVTDATTGALAFLATIKKPKAVGK